MLGRGWSKYRNGKLKGTIICENCVADGMLDKAEVNYGSSKSTGKVKQHYKTHHSDIYEEGQKLVLRGAAEDDKGQDGEQQATLKRQKTEHADIRASFEVTAPPWIEELCRFVVMQYQPPSIVSSPDFKTMVSVLEKRAAMPSSKMLFDYPVAALQAVAARRHRSYDEGPEGGSDSGWLGVAGRRPVLLPDGSAGEAAACGFSSAQMAAEEEEEGSNSMSCYGETDAAVASGCFELVAMDEVKAFQRMPRLSMQDHNGEWNDPLLWWWRHHLEFPNIAKLARCVLALHASDVSAVRAAVQLCGAYGDATAGPADRPFC